MADATLPGDGAPGTRYKRNDTWTTRLININGRPLKTDASQPPQSTHRFEVIRAVEDLATRLRHWPKPTTPAVLLWCFATTWTPKATVHQCILNNASYTDSIGVSRPLRTHGGTQFFDSLPEALNHTLTLVHRSIKTNPPFLAPNPAPSEPFLPP